MQKGIPTPLRPHLEQVEHRHYSSGLSSVHALRSGCELSGVIALDRSPEESNAIGYVCVGHLANLGYNEVRARAPIFWIFRNALQCN